MAAKNERLPYYSKIAIARKQLGIDEEVYRALLENTFSKSSATALSVNQLKYLMRILEQKGAVFTSAGKQKAETRRRDADFYEIPNHVPHALQKRYIAALWHKMGYAMTSLDKRCSRQFKVAAFLWIEDAADMQTLARDIVVRAKRKGIETDPMLDF